MNDKGEGDAPRLYGQPEEAKPEGKTSNGLRGEAHATGEGVRKRTVMLNGREVEIEEESAPQQ